ncbi:MAG: hypothetical protein SGPRY_002367 [Prymnesium sp.]
MKRTPQSAYDGAAGNDIYEPEKVVAQHVVKGGITQFLVKWVGYEHKHNAWEPVEHLLDEAAEAKRIEKAEEAAKKAAEDVE